MSARARPASRPAATLDWSVIKAAHIPVSRVCRLEDEWVAVGADDRVHVVFGPDVHGTWSAAAYENDALVAADVFDDVEVLVAWVASVVDR